MGGKLAPSQVGLISAGAQRPRVNPQYAVGASSSKEVVKL
jgi:hypothetical protein